MPRFPLRPAVAALVLLLAGLTVPVASAQEPAAESAPAEVSGGHDAEFAAEGDNVVHDITFPLPEGSYAPLYDSYTAPRSGGRVHRANDLMADKMVPVHAVVDGEIIFAPGTGGEPKPSYGYMIRMAGDDGMFYSYVHLNDDVDPAACDRSGGPEVAYAPGIAKGVRVERGQHIGWVGSSGNASCAGPHLHFEIGEDPRFEVRHNPMASLEAAESRGDFPDDVTPAGPGAPAAPGEPDEDDLQRVTRLAGGSRVETAVALSADTREGARAVVIVPADSHAEALVAAPLAGLIDAPVLLSTAGGLPAAVAEEIRRIRPGSAYLIGTPDQLSPQVESDLRDAGVANFARLQARDRFELSAVVAREILSYPDVEALDEAILALGDAPDATRAWPDALSASALAAHTVTPVLLVEGDVLPDVVADLLTEQRPDRLTVIGGTAAISTAVADDAAALADAEQTRLAGSTRYATSAAVAQAAVDAGLDADAVWVATGRNFPDALAAGPAAARGGSPLLLVDGTDPGGSPASSAWLAEQDDGAALVVVGGTSVVTDEVVAELLP